MPNHIVVVDDALPTLRLTSTIVAQVGNVLVHPFPTLADALAWSAQNGIDAFVLDHGVAATDSLEMVQVLRADARFALVPIVIVSAEAELEVRLSVLAAGANDFIERPVEPRELIARLTTLLGLHNARVSETTRADLLEQRLQSQ